MRCPTCGADNPERARRCGSCGERLGRRPRRQELLDESDSPFGKRNDTRNPTALAAYRYSVYSLIPLAGLFLGPAAVVLAMRAWREGRTDPSVGRSHHTRIAFVLGLITLVANAIGLALMWMGLTSGTP